MLRAPIGLAGIAIAAALLVPTTAPLAAASSQGTTNSQARPTVLDSLLNLLGLGSPFGAPGQPNQSCENTPNPPGNAGNPDNTGSPFSPNGKSGQVYAGEQTQNSNNPKSVSQYDAACARPTH